MTSIGIGFGIGLQGRGAVGGKEPDQQVLLLEDSSDFLLEDDEVILLEIQNEQRKWQERKYQSYRL